MKPGNRWRLRAGLRGREPSVEVKCDAVASQSTFGDLTVDNWLHIEQTGPRTWSVRLGHHDDDHALLSVKVQKDGKATVTGERLTERCPGCGACR